MNDLKDFMGCTNIINAVREGNLDYVSENWSVLSKSDFTLTVPKYNNRIVYSFAANAAHTRELLYWMPHNAGLIENFKNPDDKNRTPLMYAVNYGDSNAIHLLTSIDSKSLDRIDSDGRNLLHLLCLPGETLPKTDTILDKDHVLPPSASILQLKASKKDLQTATRYLLQFLGINAFDKQINAKDRFGMTPIDYAVAFGFEFLIREFDFYSVHNLPSPRPISDDVTVFGKDALQRYITSPDSNKDYKSNLPNLLHKYDVRTQNSENGNINTCQLAYLYNKEPDFIALLEADLIDKNPKDLLMQDKSGAIILHYAANSNRFNSIDCLKRHVLRLKNQELLIDAINHKDNDGRTALHVLVMTHANDDNLKKQVEAYSYLLANGAEVFAVDNNGHTAYDLAKLYGNNKLADAIAKLANPKLIDPPKQNLKDYLDRDFVIRCILSGNLRLQDYLKEKRFAETINTPVERYGNMGPLHFVAQALKHQTQLAQILINFGAKVSQKDDKLRAPIFYAANLQDKDLISLYLSKDPELRFAIDKDGRNLMHAFCMGGLFKQSDEGKILECFEFILPHFSLDSAFKMLNALDNFGLSPAMYAKYNNYTKLYKAFLKYKIDVTKMELPVDPNLVRVLEKDFYGFNPLMQAAYKCIAPFKEIEKKYKYEKNPMWGGDNGLHFWQEWYLHDNQALANNVFRALSPSREGNRYGSTVLHLKIFAVACNPKLLQHWLNQEDIYYLLSSAIHIKDKRGNTALHVIAMFPKDLYPGNENGNYFFSDTVSIASTNFSIQIAKALIELGVDIYAKNLAGQSAYDLANLYGNQELRDFLLQHFCKNAEDKAPTCLTIASGCLHFGYSIKKLWGSFTIKQGQEVATDTESKSPIQKPLLPQKGSLKAF